MTNPLPQKSIPNPPNKLLIPHNPMPLSSSPMGFPSLPPSPLPQTCDNSSFPPRYPDPNRTTPHPLSKTPFSSERLYTKDSCSRHKTLNIPADPSPLSRLPSSPGSDLSGYTGILPEDNGPHQLKRLDIAPDRDGPTFYAPGCNSWYRRY